MDKKHVAVIGGGIAGLETAKNLVKNNIDVTIFEASKETGGKLNDWHHLFPDFSFPRNVINEIKKDPFFKHVNIIYNTKISKIEKQNGKFEISDNKNIRFNTDAVVISTGFNVFDASLKEEYGYGIYQNVITSVDLEKILRAGEKLHTVNEKHPKRAAVIHCVGSRDSKTGNTYCSKVCCITGIKQALEINELYPECEVFCFYMDLRLTGYNFDELYLKAQKKNKIQFIRGRLSEVSEKIDRRLQIKTEDTLSGKPLRMDVDLVVLLVGMESCDSINELKKNTSILTDSNNFIVPANIHSHRNNTSAEGIFIAGTCINPMSVNETIENAGYCSLSVINYLNMQKHE